MTDGNFQSLETLLLRNSTQWSFTASVFTLLELKV